MVLAVGSAYDASGTNSNGLTVFTNHLMPAIRIRKYILVAVAEICLHGMPVVQVAVARVVYTAACYQPLDSNMVFTEA